MLKKIVLLCIGLLINLSVFAKSYIVQQDVLVNTAIQSLMKKNKIPGVAVLLYANGKMNAYYFGEADPKRHINVSENTLFEIGSITKTFTGILLAKNVIENKMHFNDPIDTNANFNNLSKITLQELATHTSSLPYGIENLPYNASTSEENKNRLDHFLKSWIAPFTPGTKMIYSNLAYGILGMILSENSKTTLSILMKQNILNPLGMMTSGLDISSKEQKYLAKGFTEKGQEVAHLPSGLLSGAWAMKVSSRDMQNYLKAILGVDPIPEKIQKAIKVSQMAYYAMPKNNTMLGLGWTITPLDNISNINKLIHKSAHNNFAAYEVRQLKTPTFNSNSLIEKGGATDGFRSYIAIIPDKKVGIVIMANRYFVNGDLPSLANKILFQITGILPVNGAGKHSLN
jgi:beta-lactamase class C